MMPRRMMPPAKSRKESFWGFWGLLVFILTILAYAVFMAVFIFSHPTDGVYVQISEPGLVVNKAPPGSVLQVGDTITHIDGQGFQEQLQTPGFWYRHLKKSLTSTYVHYLVIRDGETVPLGVRWEYLGWQQVFQRWGTLFFIGLSFILSAVFILLQCKGDEPSVCWVVVVFCLEGLNLINNAWTSAGVNLLLSVTWLFNPLDLLSFALTMGTTFYVLLIFPEPKWLVRRYPIVVYAVFIVNTLCALYAISGFGAGGWFVDRLWIYRLFLYPLAGLELMVGLGHLVHTYLATQRRGVRNQIKWLVWGLVVALLPWLFLYSFPIALLGAPWVSFNWASLTLIFIPIAFIFSVTRRNLMTVDTLINYSLVYLGLSSLLVFIYLGVISALNWLFYVVLKFPEKRDMPVLLAVLLIALVSNPLMLGVQNVVNRTFYRRRSNFRDRIDEIVEQLSTTLSSSALLSLLTIEVPERLEVSRSALLLLQDSGDFCAVDSSLNMLSTFSLCLGAESPLVKQLQNGPEPLVADRSPVVREEIQSSFDFPWEVLLPLYSRQGLMGIYTIGSRLSGDLYDAQEVKMLTWLGRQVALTLENVQLYYKVQHYAGDLEVLVADRTVELHRSNQALFLERDRLNAILHNMADGLLVTDIDGKIQLTNPAFENLVCRSSEQLNVCNIAQVVESACLTRLLKLSGEQPGKVCTANCEMYGHMVLASALTLHDASGIVTVLRDITHETEVDRMKTEFISTVSHELRTPLTSVLGFAKLVTKNLEKDIIPLVPPDNHYAQRSVRRILKNLNIIVVEGTRLTRLINDVLDISKMESGKIEWHDRPFDVLALVRYTLDAVRGLAQKKGLQLIVDLPAALPALEADPDRIHQVLFNLLSNAIKFTDAGEVRVAVKAIDAGQEIEGWRSPSEAGGILVSIEDTGVGIPESEIPNLFQRFYQVRGDALVNKPHGTGLGLAISYEIVTHYGGIIWAESSTGRGTKFSLTLPLSLTGVMDGSALESSSVISEIRRRVSGTLAREGKLDGIAVAKKDGKPLVLVVDDEEHIRTLLAQELESAGYRTVEAINGSEALSAARRYKPAIILLDVMLPDVSGFDVTRVLKADPQTAEIPILILSIIEDRDHGLALGANAYLTKPVEVVTLLNTISTLLDYAPSRRPKAMVAGQDRTVLESITALLREQGFEVTQAYDARGAIVAAQQTQPDLVILDEMLSRLNNAEVLKAIRFQNPSHTCSVIVLSEGPEPLILSIDSVCDIESEEQDAAS